MQSKCRCGHNSFALSLIGSDLWIKCLHCGIEMSTTLTLEEERFLAIMLNVK